MTISVRSSINSSFVRNLSIMASRSFLGSALNAVQKTSAVAWLFDVNMLTPEYTGYSFDKDTNYLMSVKVILHYFSIEENIGSQLPSLRAKLACWFYGLLVLLFSTVRRQAIGSIIFIRDFTLAFMIKVCQEYAGRPGSLVFAWLPIKKPALSKQAHLFNIRKLSVAFYEQVSNLNYITTETSITYEQSSET